MEEVLFDGEFFARLHTLRMSNKMKLTSGMSGGRKSSAKGNSVEFSDFREYMLGDDIRKIDWNAYGRMNRLFIKLFQEEKEGLFRIFLDGSKSMDYGERKKSVLARRIVAMLSFIVLNNLDRVYVNQVKENELCMGKGMTGKQSFQKILLNLERMEFDGKTDLYQGVTKSKFTGRGTTIVVSDFFDEDQLEELVRFLCFKKQEVILIQTLAEEEVNPDFEGHLNLIDMESKNDMKVSMSSSVLRTYRKTLADFQNSIQNIALKYHAHYMCIHTGEAVDKFIFEGIQSGQLERL